MTRPYLLTVLMCSTLFLPPHTAQAAIDAAGAEAVKTMVKEMYDDASDKLKAQSPTFKMVMTGDFKVEPKGTYYEVTSPHIIFNINEESFPIFVDYGVDHLNVMPGATPTQWRMASAMPSPIRVIMQTPVPCAPDAKKCTPTTKKTELAIHQKTSQFQFLWDHSFKTILKSDIKIENFKFELDGKKIPVTLDNITSKESKTEKSPGIFDVQHISSLKGLSIDITPENCPTCKTSGKIGIGEIAVNGSSTGFDIKKHRDFNQKMAEITNAGFDPNKGMSPQAFSALWSDIMKNGFDTMDGGKGEAVLRDLTADITKKDGKSEKFALKELKYFGGFDAWRSEKTNVNFGISFNGITLPTSAQNDPMIKAFENHIPTTANYKFDLKNLPHRKLLEQTGTMAQNFIATLGPEKCPTSMPVEECQKKASQTMQQTQLLGMQAMMTLPQLLAQAGTVATLHVDSDSRAGSVLVDGDFTANAQAVYSGVMKLKAVFGGLDSLVADLKALGKDPTLKPEDAQKITQNLGILTELQSRGQLGKDTKGNDARTYDITVDEKGVAKLNGADLFPSAKTDATPSSEPPITAPSVPEDKK